jgi:hypothetical protein
MGTHQSTRCRAVPVDDPAWRLRLRAHSTRPRAHSRVIAATILPMMAGMFAIGFTSRLVNKFQRPGLGQVAPVGGNESEKLP